MYMIALCKKYFIPASLAILVLYTPAFCQNTRETGESLYERGLLLYRNGQYHESIAVLTRSLFLDAANSDAYVMRAAAKEQLRDYTGALTDLNIGLELIPDNYEILFKRATLRYQLNQCELARQDFIKLRSLPVSETNTVFYRQSAHSPGTDQILTSQSAIQSQVFNYLGLIAVQLKNCPQTVQYFDSAIRLNQNEADYYINRAIGKQVCAIAGADEDFQKALILSPDHPIAKHNLASLSARKGNLNEAEQQLTEAINADPLMLDPYLERAYYRLLRNDFTGALADYNQAIKLDRANPEIWLNRGVAKEKLRDYQGAYRDYTGAIELDETFVKAWVNRGNVLAAQKRFVEAIEDYSAAITFQPDYGAAYYNRAIAYYSLKKLAEACDDLKNAAKLNHPIEERVTKSFCRTP
jgi:tetratricopeptide (TPR) repeat protein